MKTTSKVEPATTTETTSKVEPATTTGTPTGAPHAATPSPTLVAHREKEAKAIALAQIAAPFAAAGLDNAEAIVRAWQLLDDCERQVYEENEERRDEVDFEATMTVAQAMDRMDLTSKSTKQFRVYAEQIGIWEKCRRAGRKALVVSERELSAMLEIQRQRKKAKGTRRKP